MKKVQDFLKKINTKFQKKVYDRNHSEPEDFERDLVSVLEFIFKKPVVIKIDLVKNLCLSNEDIEKILFVAENKKFIKEVKFPEYKKFKISRETLKNYKFYTILIDGISFVLDYKKIIAEQQTSIWMRRATITIALFTVLSFVVNFSASIYPIGTDFCPIRIVDSQDYTSTFIVPFSNLGNKATHVRLSHIGDNFRRLENASFHVVGFKESPTYSAKLQIINPEVNETQVYFRLSYQSLLIFPRNTISKTCFYEKDNWGEFRLKD